MSDQDDIVSRPDPDAAESEEASTTPRRRRHVLLRALVAVAGIVAAVVAYELVTWPDVASLATENPRTTAFIERARRRAAADPSRPPIRWQPVPLSRISPDLERAVLVAEDIDFFSHHGFATAEIRDALEKAWAEGEAPRGASTLTQQLAKNLWLSPSRNPWRKVKEALLTLQLEHALSKRRILELYLNVVEFGPGVFGAEAAARHYFGVSAADLTSEQAAGLAASLPRPRSWHPGVESPGYRRHVERILSRMERAQWLRQLVE